MSPSFDMQRRLKLGLVITGAIGGIGLGVALTVLGKIVAGAPPATMANYVRNLTVFGTMGAILTPTIVWSALRRVPLWRTVIEPLAVGIAGAAIGAAIGSSAAFLVLPAVGIAAAVLRLNYSHRAKGPAKFERR